MLLTLLGRHWWWLEGHPLDSDSLATTLSSHPIFVILEIVDRINFEQRYEIKFTLIDYISLQKIKGELKNG